MVVSQFVLLFLWSSASKQRSDYLQSTSACDWNMSFSLKPMSYTLNQLIKYILFW